MEAINTLILIVCVIATLGWSVFAWLTQGVCALRVSLAGAFGIAAAGAIVSGTLGHRPLVETLLLAMVYGAAAAALVGAVQVSVWVREKGSARRDGRESSGGRPDSAPPPPRP